MPNPDTVANPLVHPDERNGDAKAQPPGRQAEDGKGQGQSQGGIPGRSNVEPAHGVNVQTGQPSGIEDERTAPGISTDKKADSTR